MNDQLIEQFVSQFESMNSRLSKIEKNIGNGTEMSRLIAASSRERALLNSERALSEESSAAVGKQFLDMKEALEGSIQAADEELQRKEKSAKAGQLMMQSMTAGLQNELVEAREEVSKLRLANTEAQVEIQNLMTSLGEYKDHLNLTDAKVKKSVLGAAELAVRDLNERKMRTEIERQMRIYMQSNQGKED